MRNTRGLIGLALVALVVSFLIPVPAQALHGSDIVLSSSPSVLGARLHLLKWSDRRDGALSYDVKGLDGARGVITFYKRAVGANGYPRGAVLQTWVFEYDETAFNTGVAADADSVSASFTSSGKLLVRPVQR
jgi:hypothetical protein